MDRVITVQYNLPAEQLTLNEDTMLSSQEEEALSKCSEAESMISRKAYECLKDIMKEVCRALSLRCFCIYLLHLSVLSWRKGWWKLSRCGTPDLCGKFHTRVSSLALHVAELKNWGKVQAVWTWLLLLITDVLIRCLIVKLYSPASTSKPTTVLHAASTGTMASDGSACTQSSTCKHNYFCWHCLIFITW